MFCSQHSSQVTRRLTSRDRDNLAMLGVRNLSLQVFLNEMQNVTRTNDNAYLFGWNQLPNVEKVMSAASNEDIFSYERFTFTRKERRDKSLWYLGGIGSGAFFHTHTAAWNACVYGAKRWYFMPPGEGWGVHFSSTREWEGGAKKTLQRALSQQKHVMKKLSSCIQRSGDILFIPQNWGHAVTNLLGSIGVANEIGIDQVLGQAAGQK